MVPIATASVALSVAVILITTAIIAGFNGQISDKVAAFTGDITISKGGDILGFGPREDSGDGEGQSGTLIYDSNFVDALRADHRVGRVEAVSSTGAIMQGAKAVQGVQLMGVDSSYEWGAIRGMVTRGKLPVFDGGRGGSGRGLVVSEQLAQMMELEIGDITDLIIVGNTPGRHRFRVEGVYMSGMQEFDKGLVFTDIRTVRSIAGLDSGAIDGYRIYLALPEGVSSPEDHDVMVDELCYELSDFEHSARGARDLYPQIFDWLDMLDLNTLIIMIIMFAVAGINMSCALLIVVLEGRRMIGVLSSQGMRVWGLRTIFLIRSCYITAWGLFWGNLVGLTLCFAQARWGIISLDAQAYMLNRVPIDVNLWDVVMVNVTTFGVITSLMIVPIAILSRIKVDDNIRYS